MIHRQKSKTQPIRISLSAFSGATFNYSVPARPCGVARALHPSPAPDRMTALQRVADSPEDVTEGYRDLAARPREFFKGYFGGRTPTESEKHALVQQLAQRASESPLFQNNLYVVQIHTLPPFLVLSIRRKDWAPLKNWRHFQQMKNELVHRLINS